MSETLKALSCRLTHLRPLSAAFPTRSYGQNTLAPVQAPSAEPALAPLHTRGAAPDLEPTLAPDQAPAPAPASGDQPIQAPAPAPPGARPDQAPAAGPALSAILDPNQDPAAGAGSPAETSPAPAMVFAMEKSLEMPRQPLPVQAPAPLSAQDTTSETPGLRCGITGVTRSALSWGHVSTVNASSRYLIQFLDDPHQLKSMALAQTQAPGNGQE